MTTVLGCLTRSVRDTARYFDACNGFDQRDPLSLPAVGGWEAGSARHDLTGMTAAIVVDLGIAQVRDEVADRRGRRGRAPGRARPACASVDVDADPAAAARRMGHGQPAVHAWPTSATPIPTASVSCPAEIAAGLQSATRALRPSSGRPPSSATAAS